MDDEYYEITSELDAREVLKYLNHLGIRNISGEVLKYFITDLKKLIRYDLQQKYRKEEEHSERPGPERLHSVSTFCSRIRSKVQTSDKVVCSRESRKYFRLRNIHSAPVIVHPRVDEEKLIRRVCSCNTVEKRSETVSRDTKRTPSTGLSNNIIIVPKPQIKKKCDPVSLYHYYNSLWAKYKPNLPGENDWSDLRWHIRQKMAGLTSTQAEIRVPQLKQKENINMKK